MSAAVLCYALGRRRLWMKRTVLIMVFFAAAGSMMAQQRSLRLSIGDPARKDRQVKVVLDAVTATVTGEMLTPRDVVSRLGDTRLVFIGESHTTMDFHLAQLKMIEEFLRAGRKVLIGLEMYPSTEQTYLDDWRRGFYSEDGFIRMSQWYENWGYNWNYYRDIFLLARDHRLPLFALNAPREIVSAVSRKGLQNLSPEEKAHLAPRIDTASEEHLALFKAFFAESMGMNAMMPESMIGGMFASQCTWDATMGYNAVQALRAHGDDHSVMVVLIGSGHVAYNLGIQRQAAHWYEGKMASIIPCHVMDEHGRPLGNVQASYADFLWGLPPEPSPLYPELGTVTSEIPGEMHRRVLSVSEGSPAASAGFQKGDVLISMDGTTLADVETMNRLMAEKRWGDAAVFVVRRQPKDGAPLEVTLKVNFRRPPPESKQAQLGK